MVEQRDPLMEEDEPTGSSFTYDLAIQATIFGFSTEYGGGQYLLFKVVGEKSYTNKEGSPVREPSQKFYSLGDGWEMKDGGQRVEHRDGPDTLLKKGTNIRLLFNRISLPSEQKGLGLADLLRQRSPDGRGDPRRAGLLDGLRFRMKQEELPAFRDGKTRTLDLPVEYLGEGGTVAAAPSAVAGVGTAPNGVTGPNPLLRAQAVMAAKDPKYADAGQFLRGILEDIPDLAKPGNEALLNEIANPAFFVAARA